MDRTAIAKGYTARAMAAPSAALGLARLLLTARVVAFKTHRERFALHPEPHIPESRESLPSGAVRAVLCGSPPLAGWNVIH